MHSSCATGHILMVACSKTSSVAIMTLLKHCAHVLRPVYRDIGLPPICSLNTRPHIHIDMFFPQYSAHTHICINKYIYMCVCIVVYIKECERNVKLGPLGHLENLEMMFDLLHHLEEFSYTGRLSRFPICFLPRCLKQPE